MKEKIENALCKLIGCPLWGWNFAGGMLMLQFGQRVSSTKRKVGEVEVGKYALHLQCSWRIIGGKGIVTGISDIFYPEDEESSWEAFDRDMETSLCEGRLSTLLKNHEHDPLTVRSVKADRLGGFQITLSEDMVLESFPDNSLRGEYSEHWRLLMSGGEHFVVTGHGVE